MTQIQAKGSKFQNVFSRLFLAYVQPEILSPFMDKQIQASSKCYYKAMYERKSLIKKFCTQVNRNFQMHFSG